MKKFHNLDSHLFDIKQETIARSGIWIAKKRYAQWIINSEGNAVNKLDVKGLDVVRSSFPPAFRKFMAEVLHDILNDIEEIDPISRIDSGVDSRIDSRIENLENDAVTDILYEIDRLKSDVKKLT